MPHSLLIYNLLTPIKIPLKFLRTRTVTLETRTIIIMQQRNWIHTRSYNYFMTENSANVKRIPCQRNVCCHRYSFHKHIVQGHNEFDTTAFLPSAWAVRGGSEWLRRLLAALFCIIHREVFQSGTPMHLSVCILRWETRVPVIYMAALTSSGRSQVDMRNDVFRR